MLRLAGREPFHRRLDAVIGAIAHQMRERVPDQLQHLPIELGLGAMHLKLDLLAEIGREIAHDSRQLLPSVADRLHARLHHAFLQLGGDIRQPLQRHLEIGILVAADDFQELIAREHKLRNRVHEMIERLDMNADGMVGEPVGALVLEPLGRGRRRRGLRGGRRLSDRRQSRRSNVTTRRGRRHPLRGGEAIELADKIDVVARRFLFAQLDRVEDGFDAIDGGKNERDGFGRNRKPVAESPHHALGGMRQRLEPRQAEKAAGSLDGVNQTKDIAEDLAVVGLLLEAHEFRVYAIETFIGLGQELTQQVVH